MAKISLWLDTRSRKKDGTYPVKIKLSHKTKAKMENTGISIKEDEWDAEAGEIIGSSPLKKQWNLKLKRQLVNLQMALLDVDAVRDIGRMEVDVLMNEIRKGAGLEMKAASRMKFLAYYEDRAQKKEKERTRDIYLVTAGRIREFDAHAENLSFEDITEKWLEDFDEWMKKEGKKTKDGGREGMKTNSRSIEMRNIRSVINDAIDDKLTDNYPFRKFKIRHEETQKRALSIEEMHKLWTMEVDEYLRYFLDMFKLSFALIGMNTSDMYNARKDQIVAGRLEYARQKTSKRYGIKLQPEALELLERYKGSGDNLLSLSERYATVHNLTSSWNEELKKIDKRLSVYWARHTWATTAAELDIPKETIAGALGHSIGMDTTSIYIRFDQRKIDKANRQVLDTVISGKFEH